MSRARGGLTLWVKGALCRVLNPMLAINHEIATVVDSAVRRFPYARDEKAPLLVLQPHHERWPVSDVMNVGQIGAITTLDWHRFSSVRLT